MPAMTRDILDALKVELAFMSEAAGARVEQFLKPGSIFRNSPICPNFGFARQVHSCQECPLMAFVPVEHRSEKLPCHHIPLVNGESIVMLEMGRRQYQLCHAVKQWLESIITALERGRVEDRNLATVLLDGDQSPLRALRPLLETVGLGTLSASTCERLSRLVQQVNPPALVFTEPILPDGTWADVLDVVKQSGATTPVIVVSDQIDKKLAVEVIERGAFDYLIAPVAILELVHVVRCALWHLRPKTYAAAQSCGG